MSSEYKKISMGQFFRKAENEMQSNLIKIFVQFFWNSFIPDFYRKTYYREPLLLLEFLTIRFHKPGNSSTNVDWHLDGNFYGFTVPLITAWMPLVEVGISAQGLEFAVPKRRINDAEMRQLWINITLSENKNRIVKDEQLEQFLSCPFRRHTLPMSPGDVCIFDQFMLHRTQVLPKATESRIAIEFRISDRNFFPPDIDPSNNRGMLVSWKNKNQNKSNIGFLHNIFPNLLK